MIWSHSRDVGWLVNKASSTYNVRFVRKKEIERLLELRTVNIWSMEPIRISHLLQTISLDCSQGLEYITRVSKTHLIIRPHSRDLAWLIKKRSSTLNATCSEKEIERLWELRPIHILSMEPMHISYLLQTSSLDLSTRTRVYDERVSRTHLNLGLHYRDLTWVFKKRSSTLSARCPEKKGIGRLWELRTIHTYPIPGPYIYIAQNSHKLSRLINQECLEYIKIARCSKKKKKDRESMFESGQGHIRSLIQCVFYKPSRLIGHQGARH